jgi:hypothetical protein
MQPKLNMGGRSVWIYGLVGAAVLILGLVLSSGFWLQQNSAAFGIEAEAAQRAGAAAGQNTDQQGCLEQASRMLSESTSAAASGIANSFLGTCLPVARETTGFCAVPTAGMEIRAWRNDRCGDVPKDLRESCGAIIGSVQQICTRLK